MICKKQYTNDTIELAFTGRLDLNKQRLVGGRQIRTILHFRCLIKEKFTTHATSSENKGWENANARRIETNQNVCNQNHSKDNEQGKRYMKR